MTYNTINTIRDLATRLYGQFGYSLVSDYDRKGRPVNWKKTYSLDGKSWHSCKALCEILSNACAVTGR